MPRNQFQRCIFALLTVIITVHGYVFYSLYVINGSTLMELTGESGVIAAINAQGGVLLLNHMVPIWAIVLVEFCFAYCLEVFLGSPASQARCSMSAQRIPLFLKRLSSALPWELCVPS